MRNKYASFPYAEIAYKKTKIKISASRMKLVSAVEKKGMEMKKAFLSMAFKDFRDPAR